MSDWQGRELHFIAIGGAGMSGLALIAHRLGARVTGSDRADSSYLRRLREAGFEPRLGHDAHALRELGADPAFLLGGELPGSGPAGEAANAAWGGGEWVVAEADESDASFLRLRPEVGVVTNVELDHHSHWGSRAELVDAFRSFAEPAQGLALLADPRLDELAGAQRVVRFDEGRPGPPLELGVPGRHNLLNARAALAA